MELHENYDAWAAMLAECFGEEAGTRAQMQGLAGTDTLLLRQCGGMLRAFDRIGGATAWGTARVWPWAASGTMRRG